MVIYADASFLVALYVVQADSPKAVACLRGQTAPLAFTSFHRHELRNAIRLCVFRKDISSYQCRQALREMENDLDGGILVHTPLAWTETLQKAEELGAANTEIMGIRSLDLFHIASALNLKTTLFLTFDVHQRALAEKSGLKVKP